MLFTANSTAINAHILKCSKNSSGDEIANMNFYTTISHTYFKIPKKEN